MRLYILSVPDFRKHGRPSLVLFYGVAYSLSALHDSVVPLEEVVCAFVAPIAEEKRRQLSVISGRPITRWRNFLHCSTPMPAPQAEHGAWLLRPPLPPSYSGVFPAVFALVQGS